MADVPTPPEHLMESHTDNIFKARDFGVWSFTVSGGDKLRNAWYSDSFALSLCTYFLFHPLGNPLQAKGVDDESRWRGAENTIPLAEPQSHQQVRGPQRHAQPCLGTTDDEVPPSASTINQAPHKGQVDGRRLCSVTPYEKAWCWPATQKLHGLAMSYCPRHPWTPRHIWYLGCKGSTGRGCAHCGGITTYEPQPLIGSKKCIFIITFTIISPYLFFY